VPELRRREKLIPGKICPKEQTGAPTEVVGRTRKRGEMAKRDKLRKQIVCREDPDAGKERAIKGKRGRGALGEHAR